MTTLSVLIVNTQGRDLLLASLDALGRELDAGGWRLEHPRDDATSTSGSASTPGTSSSASTPGTSAAASKSAAADPPASSAPTPSADPGDRRQAARETPDRRAPDGSQDGWPSDPALSARVAEILVLDNASTDGSAEAASAHPLAPHVIARATRQGKAANDDDLLAAARGRYALLMNEDSELRPGALEALVAALDGNPRAGAVGGTLLRPSGEAQPSAWAFPSLRGALLTALGRPGAVVQSTGDRVRAVDWAQSAALLVRTEAANEVGGFDRDFFVYSDEVDFQKRLTQAGWSVLWTPFSVVVHHEQLSTDLARSKRRIVEFHRGRDRYLRKHATPFTRRAIALLTAGAYLARAAAALVLPGHDARRYLAHAGAALRPSRGEGLSEAADAFNAQRPPA